MEVRIRDDEPAGNEKRMGRKMSIANEAVTKTETLREIQALDKPETSQSEIDKLEMLAALGEPAKPITVETSAEADRGPVANDSSETSAVHAADLTAEAAQRS